MVLFPRFRTTSTQLPVLPSTAPAYWRRGERGRSTTFTLHVVKSIAGAFCFVGCMSGSMAAFSVVSTQGPNREPPCGHPSVVAVATHRGSSMPAPSSSFNRMWSSAGAIGALAMLALGGHAQRHRGVEQQGAGSMTDRSAVALRAGDGDRRVVVTGMGIISPLGNTLDAVAESLQQAKSGISFCDEFAEFDLRSQVRGLPPLTQEEIQEIIPRKAMRFMGVNAQYAFIALDRAIQHAGLKSEDYEGNPRCASILGQGGTSICDVTDAVDAVKAQGKRWSRKVGPYRVTRTMGSTVSAVLSSHFKVQGPSYSISSACSTGAHCIGVGMEQILLNNVDMALAGAGEDVCWQFTAMFDCMGALSTKRNDDPTKASRAFDKDRDGFVIAGGGGMLVLEELEHAKARGAKIYAEVVGYAANADGYDVVAPSGVGGERCMQMAIAMANRRGGEKPIDYINTHGTSTPVGDVQELGAVKRVFADKDYKPWVGSTKSLSGHALGAAGVHEAIYSLLMADRGFMAKSANIDDLVDEAEGMNILTEGRTCPIHRVMSNSFGFGGTNACLVFDKWTGE